MCYVPNFNGRNNVPAIENITKADPRPPFRCPTGAIEVKNE